MFGINKDKKGKVLKTKIKQAITITSKHNQIVKKYKNKVEKSQKFINRIKLLEILCTGILLIMIFGGLFFIVVIQISSPISDISEAADIINTFTGIILGFVAMTVSLIGMVLSFHNTVRTEQSNLETLKEFTKLAETLKDIEHIDSDLAKSLGELKTKVSEFDDYKNKLEEIQRNVTDVSRDLRRNIEQSKGSSTANVKVVPTDGAGQTEFDEKTDEH